MVTSRRTRAQIAEALFWRRRSAGWDRIWLIYGVKCIADELHIAQQSLDGTVIYRWVDYEKGCSQLG